MRRLYSIKCAWNSFNAQFRSWRSKRQHFQLKSRGQIQCGTGGLDSSLDQGERSVKGGGFQFKKIRLETTFVLLWLRRLSVRLFDCGRIDDTIDPFNYILVNIRNNSSKTKSTGSTNATNSWSVRKRLGLNFWIRPTVWTASGITSGNRKSKPRPRRSTRKRKSWRRKKRIRPTKDDCWRRRDIRWKRAEEGLCRRTVDDDVVRVDRC